MWKIRPSALSLEDITISNNKKCKTGQRPLCISLNAMQLMQNIISGGIYFPKSSLLLGICFWEVVHQAIPCSAKELLAEWSLNY